MKKLEIINAIISNLRTRKEITKLFNIIKIIPQKYRLNGRFKFTKTCIIQKLDLPLSRIKQLIYNKENAMTNLERLAQNIIIGEKCGDMKKVILTITNGGVIAVETIIRWKRDGEICQGLISISKRETTEDFWYDNDFLFNVTNLPQFFLLLANLDFTKNDFDSEDEWLGEIHKCEGKHEDNYFNSKEDFDVIDVIGKYIIESKDSNEPIDKTELDCFLRHKFIGFVKKRLAEDGDDTEYEDDDDLWDKLSNYFGKYCYRRDDFSVTNWDNLVDRWEDEPNY